VRTPTGLLVVVSLLVVQRLGEVLLTRMRLAQARPSARFGDPRGNWALMVAAHAALFVLPLAEAFLRGTVAPGALWGAGLLALGAAQALRLWSLHAIGPAWNARALVAPSTPIVAHGPYRWMRHPNYLAVAVEVVALPCAAGAWLALLVLVPWHAVVLARRIRGEEALLRAIPAWRESMAHKGLLLPRFRRAMRAP
jgi:methyltransferase